MVSEPRSQEQHAVANAERGRVRFELRSQRSVARDHDVGVGRRLEDVRGGLDEVPDALLPREPRDGADHGGIRRQAELPALGAPVACRPQGVFAHAVRDQHHLGPRAPFLGGHEAPDRLGIDHDAIREGIAELDGTAGEQAWIAIEASLAHHRGADSGEPGGDRGEHIGMKQIRVDDVHVIGPEEPDEPSDDAQSTRPHQRAAESTVEHRNAHLLDRGPQLAVRLESADHRGEAPAIESGQELDEMCLRSTELEVVDHVHHPSGHGSSLPRWARAPGREGAESGEQARARSPGPDTPRTAGAEGSW